MRRAAVALAGLLALAAGADAQPFRRVAAGPALDGVDAGLVFAGGVARPRPHLVDLVGDARLDLVVQDEPGRLRLYERTGGASMGRGWTWRTDRMADADGAPLAVGEWVRFADADGDGDPDLLTEAEPNLVRLYRRDADGFRRASDALVRTDGVPVVVDRQNLPAAADLTGDGRLDLVYAQTDGTLTFFEGAPPGMDGLPRFHPPIDGWQGIQIVGEFGAAGLAPEGDETPFSDDAVKHGASALDLVDVDGDSDLDIVWGDFFSPSLYLLRNTGSAKDPRFVRAADRWPAASPPATTGYNATATGDVTGDGGPDLVVGVIGGAFGTTEASPLTVRAGQGGEAFAPPEPLLRAFDAGTSSRVAILPDGSALVTTDEGRALRITLADGAVPVPFAVPSDWPFGAAPSTLSATRLAVGDFYGRVFEATLDGTTLRLGAVLVATPRGQFAMPAAGDATGDGVPDLVVGVADGRVLLARGAAGGTFALDTAPLVPADAAVRRPAPALGDWTGDGRLDLAVGDELGRIRLFTGDGIGGFAPGLVLDALPLATPAFVDLDGDGDLDVLAGADGGGLVAFLNDRIASGVERPASTPVLRAVPNPARDAVRIDTGGRRVSGVVLDAAGRTVARVRGSDPMLDVRGWPAGLYTARLVYDDRSVAVVRWLVAR